jgi:hypothetical protein
MKPIGVDGPLMRAGTSQFATMVAILNYCFGESAEVSFLGLAFLFACLVEVPVCFSPVPPGTG